MKSTPGRLAPLRRRANNSPFTPGAVTVSIGRLAPAPTDKLVPSRTPVAACNCAAVGDGIIGDGRNHARPVSSHCMDACQPAIGMTTRWAPIPNSRLKSMASSPTVIPWIAGTGKMPMNDANPRIKRKQSRRWPATHARSCAVGNEAYTHAGQHLAVPREQNVDARVDESLRGKCMRDLDDEGCQENHRARKNSS